MKIITIKVFSLCEDFNSDEHPSMYDTLSGENNCDVYIDYTANSKEFLKKEGYGNDLVANRLVDLGCAEDENVLIHIDY